MDTCYYQCSSLIFIIQLVKFKTGIFNELWHFIQYMERKFICIISFFLEIYAQLYINVKDV